MSKKINFYLAAIILLALSACIFSKKKNPILNNEKDKAALLNVDNDFSAMSITKGMKNAYLEFIDSNGVLLRPNIYPMIGADAVDFIIAQKDDGFSMSWKPSDAVVASSGDLGYSYGTYQLHVNIPDTTFTGTYITIWKKQEDGKWKFVLHSNNEGLEEQ